jgi:putative endopeptidase
MRFAASTLALLLLASCATAPVPAPSATPRPAPLIGAHGFDLSGMKTSVNACDNFYDFAVGAWRETHPLPAMYSRFGRFEELADRNRLTLRSILEESAAAPQQSGSTAQKIGDFYGACMAESAIDASGTSAIQPQLDRINAIDDRGDVAAEIFRLQQQGIYPFFRFSAQNDYKSSKQIIAAVSQSGLGLPDRDYYLRDDERFTNVRTAYVDHITRMFELAGVAPSQARGDARRVLELETRLARAAMARVEQRNPENVYHPTPVSAFAASMPAVDWRAFLRDAGLADLQTLNVAQPEYLREADRVIAESPLESLEAYLRWQLLDAMAASLPTPFVNQDFEFRGRTLTGQKEMQPRWMRCVRAADTNLGQLVGQEYVRRAFTRGWRGWDRKRKHARSRS